MTLRQFPLVSSLSLRIFYHQLLELPSIPLRHHQFLSSALRSHLMPSASMRANLWLAHMFCLFVFLSLSLPSSIKHCRVSCCCQHTHGKKHSCNFSFTAKCFFSYLCYYFIIPDATFIFIHARIVLFVFLMPDQYVME